MSLTRGIMQIIVSFHFNHEQSPIAVTGIEGDVTDILLPHLGDLVQHRDAGGASFEGKVTNRIFKYDIPPGVAVSGAVVVTLCLDRTIVQ